MSTKYWPAPATVPASPKLLFDLPVDVLGEIFPYVEPLDLLHLARTSKASRGFLLDRRKSSTLWRNVICNIEGFPPCPDYMSPPAYTHLAFDPVCHGCFAPCETIEWELRMRCCPDCFPKMTIPQSTAFYNVRSRGQVYLDLPLATKHYRLDHDDGLVIAVLEDTVSPAFSLSDWNAAKSYRRPRNMSSKKFYVHRNAFWQSIRIHAGLCRDWEFGWLKEKAAKFSLLRRRRVEEIEARARELGWAEILSSSYYYSFLRLPQVKKLEPLMPVEWDVIRLQLIRWAEWVKRDVVWKQCLATFSSVFLTSMREHSRFDTGASKVQPREIDIVMLPAVQSALDRAVKSDIHPDAFKMELLRVVPPAISNWCSRAVDQLEELAWKQLDLPRASKPCHFPWVIFHCETCESSEYLCGRFRFDDALSHLHLYEEQRRAHDDELWAIGDMSTQDRSLMAYDTSPRSLQILQVDVTASRRIEHLIRAMGLDPSSVTFGELCSSTAIVVCRLCRTQGPGWKNFTAAFEHCIDKHRWKKETEIWTLASETGCNLRM